MVTNYSVASATYITEIFIDSGLLEYGSIIDVSNVALNSQKTESKCITDETITLTEWHSTMHVLYRYTFQGKPERTST